MSTEATACLALLLDGPMQSWGFTSRFTRRITALHPTKSAVVGLLAAALGIDKYAADEGSRIARLAELRCTTVALPRKLGGREIPVLRLSDYHTIGGGFDKKTDAMKKPKAADGNTLETVLSERHYLLEARFGVLLEGEATWLQEIAAALRDPKWGVWLGRKCCIPAAPILGGIASSAAEAWQILLARTGYPENATLEQFDRVVEGPAAEGLDAEWLHDAPVAFGAPIGERHAPRRIRHLRRN